MRPVASFRPPPTFSQLQGGTSSQMGSVGQSEGTQNNQAFSLLEPDATNASSNDSAFGELGDLLINQVKGVNAMQNNADAMVHSMLTGGDVNEAEVLTSVQKADLAFRMLMQIRNKLMDAYREIQQVQI
ncbi:flagellar hook-basal body complex protein FliE [Rhodopirellula sp. JC740]|uniref:Flagellar hook-basal body complex protein FliE n=1 Tax=Rhodopirellula halodulae TaxID=2894198 RepID=A0ABS8NPY8_9BACT|nr:flagellar hook-basal body complex protein FliE [Rhodopirellula sp. JC740]MCC9644893.1 flagellar hook-basal body complex protein FliE [Rhodopirellula sp. JC740]